MRRTHIMAILRTLTHLSLVAAAFAGCASEPTDDGSANQSRRDDAIDELADLTGAPVTLEVGDTGVSRVIAMTPGFPLPMAVPDTVVAAQNFLSRHHDAF